MKEKAKEDSSSNDFLKEKQIFSDKVKYLETKLYKCVNGKEKLDVILRKQKCSLDKVGLSFNNFKRKIFSKIKSSSSSGKIQISCFYCHDIGHIASRCYSIQKSKVPSNAWVPRRPLRTNPQGPKMVWVPKVK